MTDLGGLVEVAQAFNAFSRLGNEVETMVSGEAGNKSKSENRNRNGHKNVTKEKAECEADEDFFELTDFDLSSRPSESKALNSYKLAIDDMTELRRLKSLKGYRRQVDGSKWLQFVERTRVAVHSYSMLSTFRKVVTRPTPTLETIVDAQIETIVGLHRHVKAATDNWQAVVNHLESYDHKLMDEFAKAKASFLSYESRLNCAQKVAAELEAELEQTPKEAADYVAKKVQCDDLRRSAKDSTHKQELMGQRVVYTFKQSDMVKTKEDMVRTGLHVFRLVNDYVGTFLSFMKHTSTADAVTQRLAETIGFVDDCYSTLSGISGMRNTDTTQAATSLAEAVLRIDYKVFPNARTAAQKQKSVLERADSATTFTEQAKQMLRGNGYQAETWHQEAASPGNSGSYDATSQREATASTLSQSSG